jgi:hypothetical protein
MEGVHRRNEMRQLERYRLGPRRPCNKDDGGGQGTGFDELVQSHCFLPFFEI